MGTVNIPESKWIYTVYILLRFSHYEQAISTESVS